MAFFTSTSKSILSCFSLAIAASMVAFSAFSACEQTQDGTRGVSRGNGTEGAPGSVGDPTFRAIAIGVCRRR